jgi:hypothetical protein
MGAMAMVIAMSAALFAFVAAPSRALAAGTAVIPNSGFTGFTDVAMGATDDGSYPSAFPFNFNINYFGAEDSSVFINNNGNLTFGSPQDTFSPFGLGGASLPIIAPFFGDVDTDNGTTVNIGTGTLDGFKVFVVNWPGVECYPAQNPSVLNDFQVILVDRPDLGTGPNGDDFQIEFNYNSIQWDAGEASGGDGNCTNSPDSDAAAVGYSDGTGIAGHYYQLPGSQTSGALMDSNVTSGLIYNELNSDTATSIPAAGSPVLGRYIFTVTNGQPVTPTIVLTSLAGGGQTGTSITVAPSTDVTDSVTLDGPNVPTAGGTVTYGVYSDNACTALVVSGGTVTVTNGDVPTSDAVNLPALGTYYWDAAYSGDALNDPSTGGCSEVETVAVPPAAVATVVDDAALATAWDGTEKTGAAAFDTATVTGTTGFTPTGDVSYEAFSNGTCSGAPDSVDNVTLSAGSVPASPATAALGAGAYSFDALYSGDSTYAAQSSVCEPFTVAKAAPSPGTVVDDAALGTAWDGNESTGATAVDTASVTPVSGFEPSGTFTYSFFTNGTCAGAAADTQAVTMTGGTVPDGAPLGPLATGAYSYRGVYSGDANYLGAAATCEPFAVVRAPNGVGTVVDDSTSNAAWNGTEHTGAAAYDTATVTSVGGITPTGTVTYSLFNNGSCTGAPATTSTQTLSGGLVPNSDATSALAAGTYSYSGSYSGDGNYLPATGSCDAFAVTKATTSLGSVVDDAGSDAPWAGTETVGSTAYDTSTLTGVAGFTVAGTVTYHFFTNGTCTGASTPSAFTVSAGAVPHSASTGSLNVGGLYAFDATFSGDANYQSATGSCESFTVFEAPIITSADQVTFIVGASATFTVTASGFPSGNALSLSDGSATLPSGVSFVDNGNGTATITGTPALGTSGTYPFTIGVTNGVDPDGSQLFTLTVDLAGTVTTLSSPTNPSVAGETITLVATISVTAPASGSPTGTVTFNDGGDRIADCISQTVAADIATCTTAFADTGPHQITVDYGGDSDFEPSSGPQLTQNVDASATTTATTSTANPAVTGQTISYTATVVRTAPAIGVPAGTVTFTDGGVAIVGCTDVVLVAGGATCSETLAPAGVHSIVATFTGDSDDQGSVAPALLEQVNLDATTTSVASSPNPSTAGAAVTITVTVKAMDPGSGNPTGSVVILSNGKALATVALDSTVDSRAVFTTKSLPVGTDVITATYAGDADYTGSVAGLSGDSQVVVPLVTVPKTGAGGWGPIAALLLLLNGTLLLAIARRRRRPLR